MSATKEDRSETKKESISAKGRRHLNYQQENRKELMTPKNKTGEFEQSNKNDRRSNLYSARKSRKQDAFARGRANLITNYGVTTTRRNGESENNFPVPSQDAEKIAKEISSTIESINQSKKLISEQIDLITTKEDPTSAISKLCKTIETSHKLILSHQESSQQNLLKILALQRDQEVKNINRDACIAENSSRIQSLETKASCDQDMQKIWLTFTCPKELIELQKSKRLIDDTKSILERMEINVNRLGIMPIKAVNFQHIKIAKEQVVSLCVTFMSSNIAAYVRNSIVKFNSKLEEQGKLSEMRYVEKIFWNKDIWKLLRICWELKRVGLIENVRVHSNGILTKFKSKSNDDKLTSINVTCFNDIDTIRKLVNDIHSEFGCTNIYHDKYFMMNNTQRDQTRNNDIEINGSDIDDDDEFEETKEA